MSVQDRRRDRRRRLGHGPGPGLRPRRARGHRCWAREPEVVDGDQRRRRENALFLPGVALDAAIRATADLADLAGAAT